MWHAWVRRGINHSAFWWGNLHGRDHFEGEGVDRRIALKWILKE
jgi:hypothetical protein